MAENLTLRISSQPQLLPTEAISPPKWRLQIDEPIYSRAIICEHYFLDQWDQSNKRRKLLVRALGGLGGHATIRSAFPYLPGIAYLSILYRILTIMRMIRKLAVCVIAYLERLQRKCPDAVRMRPEARRNKLMFCRIRRD